MLEISFPNIETGLGWPFRRIIRGKIKYISETKRRLNWLQTLRSSLIRCRGHRFLIINMFSALGQKLIRSGNERVLGATPHYTEMVFLGAASILFRPFVRVTHFFLSVDTSACAYDSIIEPRSFTLRKSPWIFDLRWREQQSIIRLTIRPYLSLCSKRCSVRERGLYISFLSHSLSPT